MRITTPFAPSHQSSSKPVPHRSTPFPLFSPVIALFLVGNLVQGESLNLGFSCAFRMNSPLGRCRMRERERE